MTNVRAKFFRDADRDMVELKIVGDPNTLFQKVAPEHLRRFPQEWAAYEAGKETVDYGGTPLTDVPGVDRNLATAFALKNVHNAEMLAALSDAAALSLGMNGQTMRKSAQLLIKANEADKLTAMLAEKRGPGRPRKDDEAA